MSDFSLTWSLCRQRFVDAISVLGDEQLNWRLHGQSLSIAQMAVHLAGVEVSFTSQLISLELDKDGKRLKNSATDGGVNSNPFPYSDAELTAPNVARLMAFAKEMVEPIITNPSEAVLKKEIVSALGPVITGEGAFARLSFHPGYHLGQAYLIQTAPGFPVGK